MKKMKESEAAWFVRVGMALIDDGRMQLRAELHPAFERECSPAQLARMGELVKGVLKVVGEVMVPVVNQEVGTNFSVDAGEWGWGEGGRMPPGAPGGDRGRRRPGN